jgi:hypothetical protein
VGLAAQPFYVFGRLFFFGRLSKPTVIFISIYIALEGLPIHSTCCLPTLSNSKPRQPFLRPIWILLDMTFRTDWEVVSSQFCGLISRKRLIRTRTTHLARPIFTAIVLADPPAFIFFEKLPVIRVALLRATSVEVTNDFSPLFVQCVNIFLRGFEHVEDVSFNARDQWRPDVNATVQKVLEGRGRLRMVDATGAIPAGGGSLLPDIGSQGPCKPLVPLCW